MDEWDLSVVPVSPVMDGYELSGNVFPVLCSEHAGINCSPPAVGRSKSGKLVDK